MKKILTVLILGIAFCAGLSSCAAGTSMGSTAVASAPTSSDNAASANSKCQPENNITAPSSMQTIENSHSASEFD